MSEMMVNTDRLGEPYVGTKEEFLHVLGPVLEASYRKDLFFEGSREEYVDSILSKNLIPATDVDMRAHARIVALDPAKTQFLAESEVQDVLANGLTVTSVHGSEPYTYDSGEKTTIAHEIVSRWMMRDHLRAEYQQPNFVNAPWAAKDPEGRSLAFSACETAWAMIGRTPDAEFIGTPKQIAEVRAHLVQELGAGAMHNIERQLRGEPVQAATGLEIGDVLEGSTARRFYLSSLNDRSFERRDDVYQNYGFEMFPRGDADGGAFVATWMEVEGEMRLQQIRVIDDDMVSMMRRAQDDLQLETWAACALGQPVPEAPYEIQPETHLPPVPDGLQVGDILRDRESRIFYNTHLAADNYHGFTDKNWDQAYELFDRQGAGILAKWQESAGEMRLDSVTIVSAKARDEIKQAQGRRDEVKVWRNHEIPGVSYDVNYDKAVQDMDPER